MKLGGIKSSTKDANRSRGRTAAGSGQYKMTSGLVTEKETVTSFPFTGTNRSLVFIGRRKGGLGSQFCMSASADINLVSLKACENPLLPQHVVQFGYFLSDTRQSLTSTWVTCSDRSLQDRCAYSIILAKEKKKSKF